MGFEVFDKRRARAQAQPFVTIQKRGVLGLNHAAYAALGSPEMVELLFDRDQELMGLRAVEPKTPHGYAVRLNAKGSQHLITGTSFTAFYGIDTTSSRRWPAVLEDGILCVDLKGPTV